ncbi:MAG: hypothetical protein GXP26_05710 [Planctomycetes bacterium]|nr:hypothetical protein [Planctomycetota bacterium]
MRPWDFDTSSGQLRKAIEDLQIAWQETTSEWNDGISQKFCEEHLEPIGPVTKLAFDAVGRMQQLTNHIKQDCEQ